MRRAIPHSKPTISSEEINAVSKVIASAQLSYDNQAKLFEQRATRRLAIDHAYATSSGTAALHLALLALGVEPGDEVIIPSYCCTAVLHAIKYTGADAVLADVNPDTGNMTDEYIQPLLSSRTKAAIIVHNFGRAACIDTYLYKGKVALIEDAAQGLGLPVVGFQLGVGYDYTVLSFYATKVITTGEGGMLLSNDSKLIQRARELGNYRGKSDAATRYPYSMPDMAAAMGLVQLEKLDGFVDKRLRIAEIYDQQLAAIRLGGRLKPKEHHSYYRYIIRVEPGRRDEIRGILAKNYGIETGLGVLCPIHRTLGLSDSKYPASSMLADSAISIPIYPSLSEPQAQYIARSVANVV